MDVRGPDGKIVRFPDGTDAGKVNEVMSSIYAKPKAASRTGVLGKVDAFMRGAADMASFGGADELAAAANAIVPLDRIGGAKVKTVWETGDFGKAYNANVANQRATDRYDSANNGGARLLGQIAGGVAAPIPGAKAIKGLAGMTKAPGLVRAIGEGVVQGGLYGVGSGEGGVGNRAKSGAVNAAAGAAGGAAGFGLVKGAGRLLAPKVNPNVRMLADAGVVMTPGQRAGPGIRRTLESIGKSIPGANVAIGAAERRGIEQFNKAFVNKGLEPIGASLPKDVPAGTEAIRWAQDAVGNAYDSALKPMVAHLDDTTIQGWQQAAARAADLPPNEAATFNVIAEREIKPFIPADGVLTGENLQQIDRILRTRIAGARASRDVTADLLADSLEELRGTILDSAARYSPQHLKAYQAANAAEANMARVYDAASKAHGDHVFTPRQASTAVGKRGYGTSTKNVAAGNARMQGLADAAIQVLPDRMPNSGTPIRQLGMAAAGMAGTGGLSAVNPALAIPAAGIAPYLPGIDRALQAAALRRPELLNRIGRGVGSTAPIGGLLGTGYALSGK